MAKAKSKKPVINGNKVESIAERRATKAGNSETKPPAAETKGAESTRTSWPCTKCGQVNKPDGKGVFQKCTKCGEPAPGDLERLKAGLQGIAGGVNTAENVEEAARREEGLGDKKKTAKPTDAELPFPQGRFDASKSWDAVFKQRGVVREAERTYDRLHDQAKEAKATLDREQDTLNRMIDVADEKRRTDARQPYLKDEGDAPPALKPCAWEVEHPGQKCPICSKPGARVSTAKDKDHIQDAEITLHEQLAPTVTSLHKLNIITSTLVLAGLEPADRDALIAHGAKPGAIPPPIILKAHIATGIDLDSSTQQNCSRCGERLWYRESGAPAYAKGTFVLFSPCEPDASKEPARQLHTARKGKTPQTPGTTA